jgi:hypothetical protein
MDHAITWEALMSFDLRITFTGMCLYVPDPTRGRMHVLMPRSGAGYAHGEGGAHGGHEGLEGLEGHSGHGRRAERTGHNGHADHGNGVEEHVVRVFADAAHVVPGAGERTGTLAGLVKLDDRVLDLAGLDASPLHLDLSGRQLADVGKIVGQPVPRKRLDGPDEKVFCRVTLDGGAATGNASGAVWEVDGIEQPLTFRIEWTLFDVQSDGGALRLRLSTPDGTPAEEIPALFPIPGADGGRPTIDLHVFHTPETELPPWPRPDRSAPSGHHFLGLYDLFDNPGKRPVPQFRRPPKPDVPGPIGADPQRCMSGQGSTGGG